MNRHPVANVRTMLFPFIDELFFINKSVYVSIFGQDMFSQIRAMKFS